MKRRERRHQRRTQRHQRRMQRQQHKHNLRLLKKGAEGKVVSTSEQAYTSSDEHQTSHAIRPRRFGCCLLILVLVVTLSVSLPFWIFL